MFRKSLFSMLLVGLMVWTAVLVADAPKAEPTKANSASKLANVNELAAACDLISIGRNRETDKPVAVSALLTAATVLKSMPERKDEKIALDKESKKVKLAEMPSAEDLLGEARKLAGGNKLLLAQVKASEDLFTEGLKGGRQPGPITGVGEFEALGTGLWPHSYKVDGLPARLFVRVQGAGEVEVNIMELPTREVVATGKGPFVNLTWVPKQAKHQVMVKNLNDFEIRVYFGTN